MKLNDEDKKLLIGAALKKAIHIVGKKKLNPLALEIERSTNKSISYKVLEKNFIFFYLNGNDHPNSTNKTFKIIISYISGKNFNNYKEACLYFLHNKPNKETVEETLTYLFKSPTLEEDIEKKDIVKEQVSYDIYNNNSKTVYNTIDNRSITTRHNLSIIAIIIISSLSIYFLYRKNTTSIKVGKVEVNTNFKQVYPTKPAHFLDKNQKPLVWYASYNNTYDFFNSEGVHPISNEKLQPVTPRFLDYYLKERKLEKITNYNQQNSKTLNTSIHKEKQSENSTNIPPTITKKKKIEKKNGVQILNNETLDIFFSNYFKERYPRFQKEHLYEGTIKYIFSKSALNNKLIICDINFHYSVVNSNNEKIENKIININGSGFTKEQAKQNAINNIKF